MTNGLERLPDDHDYWKYYNGWTDAFDYLRAELAREINEAFIIKGYSGEIETILRAALTALDLNYLTEAIKYEECSFDGDEIYEAFCARYNIK